MSASINDFKSVIGKRGVARDNRFLVIVPPIRGVNLLSNPLMNAIITQVAGDISKTNSALGYAMICTRAEIPTRTFMTIERREYPRPIEMLPYAQAPQSMQMSFIVGRDNFEYYFFEQWQNDILNRESNTLNYYDQYTTSIIVSQLDEDDNVITSVELEGCYPVAVQPIVLDMNSKNQYVTLNVTMNYKKYRPILTPYSLAETALSLVNKASSEIGTALGGIATSALSSIRNLL